MTFRFSQRRRFTTCCGSLAGPIAAGRLERVKKKLAGSAGRGEAAGLTASSHAAPALETPTSYVAGLMDTHAHSAPDVFERGTDDVEAAQLCRDRGMAGIVLKNHVVPTADRAWFVRKHVAGIETFGGIVLNAAVGGINPDAVRWMCRMQGGFGRCVWFPTIDADHHVRHFGDAPQGIRVIGPDGLMLPEVCEVLQICARQKLVVHTGHLSPAEALMLIAAARDAGVDRIVVTHAQFEVVNMSMAEMKKSAEMGAKLELCAVGRLMGPLAHMAWMRAWRQVCIEETCEAINSIGAENFVLGTDLGQAGNPTHADGLQSFVEELMKHGIPKEQIRRMGRETPGALLMG